MDSAVAIAGVGASVLLHWEFLMHSLRRGLSSRCSSCLHSCPNSYVSYLSPPVSQKNTYFVILGQIVMLLEDSWKFYWKYVLRTSAWFPDGRMLLLASSGPYANCCLVWENEMNGKQYIIDLHIKWGTSWTCGRLIDNLSDAGRVEGVWLLRDARSLEMFFCSAGDSSKIRS